MPLVVIICPICDIELISQGPSTLKWHQRRSRTCRRHATKAKILRTHARISFHTHDSLVVWREGKAIERLRHLIWAGPKSPQWKHSQIAYYPKWVIRALQLGIGPTRIRLMSEEDQIILQMEYELIHLGKKK